MLGDLFERWRYWKSVDRIGPDILTTHWKLYFKKSMLKLCQKKFKYFDPTAEFRPGAYAINCSKISIGKGVIIRPNTMLFGTTDSEIIIEDEVLLGSGVHIYTSNHKFDNPDVSIYRQGHSESKNVLLKKGCWVGANAIILPGVVIGINAVVAASSVVNHSVKSKTIVGGNPIVTIKKLDD